jgi:transcriptional regulator with PAS, ATPase and Fis domain
LLPTDFEFNQAPRNIHHQELTLEEMEKHAILESLKRNGNNLSVVAAKLGITRQTLYNKLRKYDL